jgi:hypothetical protein
MGLKPTNAVMAKRPWSYAEKQLIYRIKKIGDKDYD